MKTKLLLLALIIIITTTFTGCWNYTEIEGLTIVTGIAVDKGEAEEYKLTYEVADIHEAGRDSKIKSRLLETSGSTIFEAVREAIEYVAPRLYFGHLEVVIISQAIARDGIIEIVDFLCRDAEPRLSVDFLISKGKTAKEILHTQAITAEIHSYEIRKILDAEKFLAKLPKVEVYKFVNNLCCEGESPFLPAIGISETAGEKTSKVSGLAVFKEDKLIGFLAEEETLYFNFIISQIKGGVIALENSPKENSNVSMEIFKSKTKVKPVYIDGEIHMKIDIMLQVLLGEQGAYEELSSEAGRSLLKKAVEEKVRDNITKVIQKVQKKFGVDIFGFGRAVQKDIPSSWKEIEEDWDAVFKDLQTNVNVLVEINDSGLIKKIAIGK